MRVEVRKLAERDHPFERRVGGVAPDVSLDQV